MCTHPCEDISLCSCEFEGSAPASSVTEPMCLDKSGAIVHLSHSAASMTSNNPPLGRSSNGSVHHTKVWWQCSRFVIRPGSGQLANSASRRLFSISSIPGIAPIVLCSLQRQCCSSCIIYKVAGRGVTSVAASRGRRESHGAREARNATAASVSATATIITIVSVSLDVTSPSLSAPDLTGVLGRGGYLVVEHPPNPHHQIRGFPGQARSKKGEYTPSSAGFGRFGQE